MPTESALPAEADTTPLRHPISATIPLKCSVCGLGALGNVGRNNEDATLLLEPVCSSCVRSEETRHDSDVDILGLGIDAAGEGIRGRRRRNAAAAMINEVAGEADEDDTIGRMIEPVPIPRQSLPSPLLLHSHSHSLPSQPTRPWTTSSTTIQNPIPESPASPDSMRLGNEEVDAPPNPLLDVSRSRMPSVGRGALYPGSVFKGTQTSGRSAYEVEVRILDVNFPESSLSGYLSISHLTDAHPHLTTFFTGEIIGPKYGFITGAKYGATEHDDMRHWGRFEQFRRPSTRADMVRPELYFRDPLPDRTRGETKAKERDFVFLRIKERFLVPDHTVRDISGASFAGFYFAMVDLSPAANAQPPTSPMSPTTKTVPTPTSPALPRRMSSSGDTRSASRPDLARRRQSSHKLTDPTPTRGEATIRGYYFHSLNQEPFQELFLTHVPTRSSSTMEMR